MDQDPRTSLEAGISGIVLINQVILNLVAFDPAVKVDEPDQGKPKAPSKDGRKAEVLSNRVDQVEKHEDVQKVVCEVQVLIDEVKGVMNDGNEHALLNYEH